MAAYKCDLDKNQYIYLENQGKQTIITLFSGSLGQQQSQGNSFETGSWRVPPSAFQTANGIVLRIEGEQGDRFMQVQANSISKLDTPPPLNDAKVLSLQKIDNETVSNHSPLKMSPMQPMEPMKPMQMGNMEMRMGKGSIVSQHSQAGINFCSQCGNTVKNSDRFCSSCGNRLE